MWILIITISYLVTQNCLGIYLVDLPTGDNLQQQQSDSDDSKEVEVTIQRRLMKQAYPRVKNDPIYMRPYQFRQHGGLGPTLPEAEKDLDLKKKISTLVQQTVHDTERKVKSIQSLKSKHKDKAPYKIGFILSLIKKARDVLNELFNVAVKHRDEWKALEQLKIFELIVHTNVDTTNLVRQLVEIHIQNLNTTSGDQGRRRVVLL